MLCEESFDVSEGNDLIVSLVDVTFCHAEDCAAEVNVLFPCQLGMESGTDLEQAADAAVNFSPAGGFGGGQLGYNYQWNKWLVLGAEADFQGTDIEGHDTRSPILDITGTPNTPPGFLFAHERMQWLGTVRGRIGFAPICRLLIYGTGGFAYGNVDYSANTDFENGTTYPTAFTETKTGWTAGGGLEYALNNHWTIRAEYLHYDLGDASRTQNQLIGGVPQGPPFFVRYNFDTSGEVVRGGLNFKF